MDEARINQRPEANKTRRGVGVKEEEHGFRNAPPVQLTNKVLN